MAINPTQTRKTDLEILARLTENNSPEGLKAAQEYIDRALMTLERRLQDLRSDERLLVQWIRRDTTLAEVEEKYNSDHFKKINPTQGYAYTDSGVDPHEYNVYTSNKLIRMEGIGQLLREQEKIRTNINYIQSHIDELKNRKEKINKILEQGSITNSDLSQYNISKITTSEIFILYELNQTYKKNALNIKNEEAYTQDPKIIRLLENLQMKFVAFAERNTWVTSGKIVLDLENPGSEENEEVLSNLINILRSTGTNENLYQEVRRYSQEMRRNINDPTISKDVSAKQTRRDEPNPEDSQAQETKTLAKFWNLTKEAAQWWSTHALATLGDAAEKNFNNFIRNLHGNKPFCDPPQESEEEAARNSAETAKDEADEAGLEEQQKRMAKAEESQTDPLQKQLNALLGQNEILDEFIKGHPGSTSGTVTDINDIMYGIGTATYSYDEKIYNDAQRFIKEFESTSQPSPGLISVFPDAQSNVNFIDDKIDSAERSALQDALDSLGITDDNYTIISQGTVIVEKRNNVVSGMAYAVIQ